MPTYSFKDVTASITGPGGSFAIGSGAGVAEEGIDIEFEEDKNSMKSGSDGEVMHSLHASKAGSVTVSLLKTSPTNAKLSQMYNLQTASSLLHGGNMLSIKNGVSGDSITLTTAAFKKHPTVKYTKDGDVLQWKFEGVLDLTLGGGLLQNLASVAGNLV